MVERIPEPPISSSIRIQPKNGFKKQVGTRFFFIFCQIFAIFDDFSKFRRTFGMLHFEKSSNMAKNEENSCYQYAF